MLALAGALAFGIGGRDVAAQIWAQTYEKSQEATTQARRDVETGKDRAAAQLQASSGRPTTATPPSEIEPRPLPPFDR